MNMNKQPKLSKTSLLHLKHKPRTINVGRVKRGGHHQKCKHCGKKSFTIKSGILQGWFQKCGNCKKTVRIKTRAEQRVDCPTCHMVLPMLDDSQRRQSWVCYSPECDGATFTTELFRV